MARLSLQSRLEFDGKPLGLPFVGGSGFDSSRRRRVGLGEHCHPGHELTFVFDGQVHWETAGGERLTLTGGDLAITQPGVPHWGHLQIIEPAAFFWINVNLRRSAGRLFSDAERARLLRALTAAGNTVRHAGEPLASELVRLHDDLRALQSSPDPLTLAAVRARIGAVLLRTAGILSAPDRRESHDYAQAAQTFIKARLADPQLCVADIAAHVGISPSHLHALFKERAGMTPNDFLQRNRVERAQELLRTTDRPVTRIAMECGFSSSQYFATCFRKYAGVAPGEIQGRSAYLTLGTDRSLQILRARMSLTSVCLGTAERRLANGLIHHEWRPPSRSSWHPLSRRCFSSCARFIPRRALPRTPTWRPGAPPAG